ncbi:MAG: hypothetical protein LBN36_04620 [Clostridiales Family XIII bacterium]|jgi:uncharacterized surface anchored protein|nr:hypothetical protein [Clostridiales Family XIII bacterium]
MQINTKLKRPLAVMMAVLLLFTTLVSLGNSANVYAGEIIALASNESFTSVAGGSSPYNIDTVWRHYRSDGALAYCRQKGIANPDGTVGNYYINSWEPGEESLIAGLFANADSIAAQYGIGGDDKRALIQMTVWAVESHFDSMNPKPESITSSNPTMLAAFRSLYNAAMAGYTVQTASISGLSNGQILTGQAFNAAHVRYGPFSVSGSTYASAAVSNAPAGSFFGDASGNPVNKDNLANGQVFYLYIPFGAGSTAVPNITIRAGYNTVSVTKYNGFWGFQDQIVGGDPGSGEISVTGTALGFGKATLWKHDDEVGASALSGASFTVDQWSNSGNGWVASGVSVNWNASNRRYETGTLIETENNGGRFRIRETAAPYSYLSGWSGEVNVHNQYGTSFSINATDKPVKLRIDFVKKDRNTNASVPQGDAKLSGAIYGLYMNEDREHPNGTKYTKDQKIAEGTTDANGKIVFADLFPAMYYIKELSPSEGYLLDDTKYEIDGRHDGVAASVVRSVTATEQVKKQAFQLIKGGDVPDETEMDLLKAGFKIYLISDLTGLKNDASGKPSDARTPSDFIGYDFSGEPTAKIDGVATGEIFTDTLGYLKSPELPYGTYVVAETTVPRGKEAIKPFIVKISGDSRTPQAWRLMNDKQMMFYVRVVKKDADTGNTVLGKSAKYRIFDLDKGEYIRMKSTYPSVVWHGTEDNPFATDAAGKLITPEKLVYGNYRLDEVAAPAGYVLAGHEENAKTGYDPVGIVTPDPRPPVYIEFDSRTPVRLDDTDDVVLEVVQENEQQRGKINIEKKGEKPDAVTFDKDGNAVFGYTDEPLEGVTFDVIASGDVVSQDGSGTVVYKDGEVVCTNTTDAEGHAWAEDLLIGDYILRETDAPAGYMFVDDEHFSITKIDQSQQYSFITWDLADARMKLDVEIIKNDKDTGAALAGAEFTLYAAEDTLFGAGGGIWNEIKDALAGKTNLIEKDAAIATAVTDKDGTAVFHDLPPGKYYVQETKAPAGYILNKDWKAEFTLAYDENRTEEVQTFTDECQDTRQRLNIEIVKEDAQSHERLEGGEFILFDEDGKEVSKAVTGKDGVAKFTDIPAGEYRVLETKAPDGYQINPDFHPVFTLKYDENGTEVLTWKDICPESKVPPTPAPKIQHLPKTADPFPVRLFIVLAALAGVSLALLLGRKKKAGTAK